MQLMKEPALGSIVHWYEGGECILAFVTKSVYVSQIAPKSFKIGQTLLVCPPEANPFSRHSAEGDQPGQWHYPDNCPHCTNVKNDDEVSPGVFISISVNK